MAEDQLGYSPATHFTETNLAEVVDADLLKELGDYLADKITEDDKSRQGWLDQHNEALRLAVQVKDKKNTPWPDASNVKYPLLTNACLQFHARALPALVGGARPVKPKVIGRDPKGEKLRRAMRISSYMSWQLTEQMEEWIDELDRLLFILPMIGVCYKKTYYSPSLRRLRSDLLTPKEVIVNYEATSFDRARVTEILPISKNEYIEHVREGLWLDVIEGDPEPDTETMRERDAAKQMVAPKANSDTPYTFYQSHCWYDLDDDGYEEPYVVTLERVSKKVVRISPRWEEKNLIADEDGNIIKIKAENYFTQWIFLPDPHSAVSGLGYGSLLGPTNEAINTMINQLIDAGTKEVLGGGFLGRGARMKGGAVRLLPGEWKLVNTAGDDLRKAFVPVPTPSPSTALLQLTQLLISVGDQTGSITDMIKGENPGQNQKVGTTMAVLEQGMKVYTSIYSRLHRALTKEYKQIYSLNRQFLDNEEYQEMLDELPEEEELVAQLTQQGATDEQIKQALAVREEHLLAGVDDFEDDKIDITPASEPSMVSDTLQQMKAQSLMEKLGAGLPLNVEAVTRRVLEAEQHQDIEELMSVPPPPPSVEDRKLQLETLKEMREGINSKFDNLLKIADAESKEAGTQIEAYKAAFDNMNKQFDREQQERQNATQQQASSA